MPFADLRNPQSLNLYAYVWNSPATGVDPSGHEGPDGTSAAGADQDGTGSDQTAPAQPNQNTTIAQVEEPEIEREEERPEEQAERALEPVEPQSATPPAAETPEQKVLDQHSASDIQAVRNGACSVDPKLAEAIRVNDTFNNIKSGGPFPYTKDNTVFKNSEGKLPSQPLGYYKEFTISPASGSGRGEMRLVTGAGGEVYQTNDHYQTFVKIAGP